MVVAAAPPAFARAQKKAARTSPAPETVADDQEPAAEWKLIDDAAARLRSKINARPKDDALRAQLAALALRSAVGAERALAIGDAGLFDAYRRQFVERFHDARWRIGQLAQKGSGVAEYASGVILLHGYFEAADVPAACGRFEAALAKGYAGARFRLSQCVEKTDPGRAAALVLEAADSGQPVAAEIAGRECLQAKPPDAACAWERLTLAAAAGRPSAQSLLAWMYAQGIGGRAADLARANRLYELAARAGDVSAQNNLGELYETGRGVRKDPKQALTLYRRAAERGFAPAQFNLGRLYATGSPEIPQDKAEARKWLESAERGGVAAARQALEWIDREGANK